MKTKRRGILAAVFGLLFFTGCTGILPSPTATQQPEASAEAEHTVMALNVLKLEAAEGVIRLSLQPELRRENALISVHLAGTDWQTRQEVCLASGIDQVEIACPEGKNSEEICLTLLENERELAFLKLKNGLPQLTADGVQCVIAAMTDEEKTHLVAGAKPARNGVTGATYPIDRLGVPAIQMADGPAGIRFTAAAVWYPSVSNLTASWDRQLIRQIGRAIGEDALGLGMDMVLAPGMNLHKNLLGGRNFEYCSEDPLLTAQAATAYVNGLQSTGARACIKHFALNNQETARYTVSSNVTERAMREIYLKAFAAVVRDADPAAVMSSYNRLNGVYTSDSYDLLTGILREEMGFDGVVMSDWESRGGIVDKISAGNDLNMPGYDDDPAKVRAALKKGMLTQEALDQSCRNILKAVTETPSFKGLEMNNRSLYRQKVKEHNLLAEEAAADTVVLLKNSGALPFAAGTSVAVFGNGVYQTVYGGMGSGSVNPTRTVSIAEGIRTSEQLSVYDEENNIFKGCREHVQGDESADVPVSREYAQRMASGADAAVIVISRGSMESADRSYIKGDFLLNDTEAEMVQHVSDAFHAKGKKVVAVLNMGAPMEVASWRDSVDALLYCGYAGQLTGTAIARVLTGEVSPSAKTVDSWPIDYSDTPCADSFPGNALDTDYYEDIYVGYRYFSTFDVPVAYPFGFGLSYTEFDYSQIRLQQNSDGIQISLTVKNVGKATGREVVQAYVSKPETLQEQAETELCGFEKTSLLEPGQSEQIHITVSREDLLTYDSQSASWVLDSGVYRFFVGANSADLLEAGSFTENTRSIVQTVENRCVPDREFSYLRKATYDPDALPNKRVNLALDCQAASNYCEGAAYAAGFAVDGSRTSRWSGFMLTDADHWWQVDLGQDYQVGQIEIFWEAIGKPFTVLVSRDGEHFEPCGTYTCDQSLQSSLNLHGETARWIRLEIPRGYFVSIFEFQVYPATEADLASKP